MLRGERVELRARRQSDIAILHAELEDDVEMRSRAGSRPWVPISVDAAESPYGVDARSSPEVAAFSVVALSTGELVGETVFWGIDTHNRNAHIGLSLFPSSRGHGYGADVVAVLCHYGFVVRGLHRLQIETLADNAAMIGAARKSGFVQEATLRSSAWVLGEFLDEVILGLLAEDWLRAHQPPPPR
jgi:RimJ/RimL family protein N-acetyltransferase